MKTDNKLLALSFLLLTTIVDAKSTPLEPNIDLNSYTKHNGSIKLSPVNLVRPASLSSDDIDYRELFSMLIRISL
jgi:hypothetical protein